MRTFIKLVVVIILSFSCASYAQSFKSETTSQYILKVSWKNEYHGKVSRYWLLEENGSTLQDYENLQLNNFNLKVTPLISPRYPQEYLFCCEKKNIDAINSKNSQPLIDSLGGKYEHRYKEYYNNEILQLNHKKALLLSKDTLNRKYEISLFKMEVQVCKCKAANNNPGSSYTDTVANISKIISYEDFTKKEKQQIKSSIEKVFANKIIQEGLPTN
ncbi:MAG TPA: hypothetical protein VI461_07590 [Chitinophagaceae bacterium]|nr:hypothetical protein [Chitinophagaceae bacterium]